MTRTIFQLYLISFTIASERFLQESILYICVKCALTVFSVSFIFLAISLLVIPQIKYSATSFSFFEREYDSQLLFGLLIIDNKRSENYNLGKINSPFNRASNALWNSNFDQLGLINPEIPCSFAAENREQRAEKLLTTEHTDHTAILWIIIYLFRATIT